MDWEAADGGYGILSGLMDPRIGSIDCLKYFCYLTAAVVPALAIRPAYRVWKNKQLPVGGRRPDATIAALLFSAAWSVYGITERDGEAFFINVYGCLVQLYCTGIFLYLASAQELMYALWLLQLASYYLACVIGSGLAREDFDVYLYICTATGWLSASAPLLVFVFSAERTTEMLPPWGVSVMSMIHGVSWCARGVLAENYFGASQNCFRAFCSLILVALVLFWPRPPATAAHALQDPLLRQENGSGTKSDVQ